MRVAVAILMFQHFFVGLTAITSEYCYAKSNATALALSFSTKTAYQKVKGTQDEIYHLPNCSADKIWLIVRHGTRMPNKKAIRRFSQLEQLRDEILDAHKRAPHESSFCEDDIHLLSEWKWQWIREDDSNILTAQGRNDLKLLAAKFKRIFPQLFSAEYDPRDFRFKHTSTQRTKESFESFFGEIFAQRTTEGSMAEILDHKEHLLLRPYELCDTWIRRKKLYTSPESEVGKFKSSETFLGMIDDISSRLKLGYELQWKDIKNIYDICRYEQAWNIQDHSPWCSMITNHHAEILEYLEDLKYYYTTGPGGMNNDNVHCFTVSDLIAHMESGEGPRVVAYFTHASAIQLFLTSLGFFQGSEILRGDNFDQVRKRNWRTSTISPFAANLAAVMYKCDNEATETPADKIKFFLNERNIEMTQCKSDDGSCRLSELKEMFEHFDQQKCAQIYCDRNSNSLE